MRAFAAILGLLVAIVSLPALPVEAHHSWVGGADCGTHEWDDTTFLTKGRKGSDLGSMVGSVDHTVGCKRVVKKMLIFAGVGGIEAACERRTRAAAVATFAYYFDTEVDPAAIKVTCRRYEGKD